MGSTGLEGLSVLHHGLDRHCIESTGETLVRALVADDDRKGHRVAGEVSIYVDHTLLLLLSLLCGSMCGMSLLPEEFGGTEEESCPHLPAYNVGPLVAEDWKVSP